MIIDDDLEDSRRSEAACVDCRDFCTLLWLGEALSTLEPVINFRAGGVAPQPEGLGPISLISSSLVARRYSIFVAPRSSN